MNDIIGIRQPCQHETDDSQRSNADDKSQWGQVFGRHGLTHRKQRACNHQRNEEDFGKSLNQSIAWRDEVNLADPLVAETGKEGPTVGDLLEAMKTADYVGRAHHTLGWLYLDRGQAEQAEKHFDGAVKDGVRVPWGYRKLGQWFEREDNPQGAFRAYLKHLGQYGEGAVLPARDAWRNLGEMFRG